MFVFFLFCFVSWLNNTNITWKYQNNTKIVLGLQQADRVRFYDLFGVSNHLHCFNPQGEGRCVAAVLAAEE